MKQHAVKLLIFCASLSLLVGDISTDVSRKSNELNKVRFDIDTAKQTMQRLSQEKNKLQAQLADIEKRYGETAAEVKALGNHLAEKQRGLHLIAQTIQHNQTELAQQRQELVGQIQTAYALGQKEPLKLLLNQQQPALSSRMIVYYRYLNAARSARIVTTENLMQQLNQLRHSQHMETEALTQAQQQENIEQTALNNVKKERDTLLAQLSHEVSSQEQQLNRLKDSETKLQNLIASLQNQEEVLIVDTGVAGNRSSDNTAKPPSVDDIPFTVNFASLHGDFASLKGKLPWPVRGKLAQKFASKRSEGLWDGIVIDAVEGAEIHAVSHGKIAFADWLRGYGLLVIIDHGNEYMSLYAFNQSIYKKIGDTVDAGDVIASVGQSGGRHQTGLYFGIRKKGVPIDPLDWCSN